MVSIFQFVSMVYHIDWFVYIEESLHPWNKPMLIMVYELFEVLLNSKTQIFLFIYLFITFYFVLGYSQLTMLQQFQVNS